MFIFASVLLVLSVVLQATLVTADAVIPWPANYPLCQGNQQVSFCDRGNNHGIRWCSDGCLFWTCGFCFATPAPEKQFAWPPVVGGNSIKYQDITESMLIQWLQLRRVDTHYTSGKDRLFQLAAADVAKVECKVGVQGGPGF